MSEIYAFYDTRYLDSIKVGLGSASAYLNGRAQGYSPSGIACKARWLVQGDARTIERQLHSALESKRLVLPNSKNPWRGIAGQRNGNEWFSVEIGAAVREVETVLDQLSVCFERASEVAASNQRKDFLQSEPSLSDGKASYPGRLVLWVMEECFTGRIKVYQCSEWYSPLEITRTYSRNGFHPIGYFTYADPISLGANMRLDRVRTDALRHFGVPVGRQNFGWLVEGVGIHEVVQYITGAGKGFLAPWTPLSAASNPVRPSGVRMGQSVTTIPASESDAFDPTCLWSNAILEKLKRHV